MAEMIHIETNIGESGNKTYRAYFNKDLRRYRTSFFSDKDEAFKEGIRLRANIGTCTGRNRHFLDAPCEAFFDYWLEKYSKVHKKSWKKDQTLLGMYIKPYMGKYKIVSINKILLEEFFNWLRKQPKQQKMDSKLVTQIKVLDRQNFSMTKIGKQLGVDRKTVKIYLDKDIVTLSNSTINKVRALLHKIFNDAIRSYGLITTNPVDGIRKLREGKKKVKYWSVDEIQRFISINYNTPLIALYVVMINTGLRVGEALGLKFKKITTSYSVATACIDEQWKSDEKIFDTPKWDSVRDIPLNSTVTGIISKQKNMTKFNQDLVFVDDSGAPLYYDRVRRDFEKCCKRADLKLIGLHGLRDIYITHYLMNKPDDWLRVKELAGHKDFKTTLIYVNFVKEFLIAEPEVFNIPLNQDLPRQNVCKIR